WPSVAGALAVSGSEHDGCMAAVSKPVDLGRVLGFDVRNGVGAFLVHRIDTRSCDLARSSAKASGQGRLRNSGYGMARLGAALAPIRDCLLAVGRTRDAAGCVGSHGCEFRLRGGHHSGMARHDLST